MRCKGIVNLSGRGMLVVSEARRSGRGNSFARLLCCPAQASGGRKRRPGSAKLTMPFPLPKERRNANLNTATFDPRGVLWFTGQNGVYGRLDPKSGIMAVFDAPRGTGPYGIAATPDGQVFFASLAGNYLGRIDIETGTTTKPRRCLRLASPANV